MPPGPLAVAEDMAHLEDPGQARDQQLLHGEFWRGVQIALQPLALGPDQLGRERDQMRLQPRADLKRRGIDLQEAFRPPTPPASPRSLRTSALFG